MPVTNDNGEKKSQETTNLLAEMLDIAPNLITIHDQTGKFLYANQKSFEIHGYTNDEFMSLNLKELDVPASAELVDERFKMITENGHATFEVEHFKKDGSILPIEVFVKLVDWKGTPAMLSIGTDISARKKAEQELKESEMKFKAAFHTSPDSVNINKLNGEYVEINEGFTRLTGYSADDVIGKLSSEIKIWAVPEDREKLIDGLKKDGIVENLESMFRTKDGKLTPALMSAKIINLNNQPHILSVTRDIAERKKYEQEIIQQNEEYESLNEELKQTNEELFYAKEKIEETSEKFQLLFENAGLGIGYFTPEGIVISFNNLASTNMNGKPEDFIGKSIFDLFPKESAEQYLARIKSATLSDTPSYYEDLIELPNESKWFISTYTKIANAKNEIIGIQIISQDISERKKSISALQQIEWMLTEKEVKNKNFKPEYGDLSVLNTKGTILSLVGKEQLLQISSEYLDLLETSSAIYEKNGDYALGLFSSSWCQTMDTASRKLCKTDSNEEALQCGKWLCHESCWHDASLNAIESGKPADIKCKGGIRLFAVPIHANGKVIGAINFGYGNPPENDDELQNLSDLYQVPIDKLRKKRKEYQIRPQYIIDFAKRRIQHSAQYLGNLIERKQAELLLHEKTDEIEAQNEELSQTNSELFEAKERAEASERHFKSLIENAPDGVVVLDANGTFKYASPNAERQFGYSKNEVIGHSGSEFTHPDDNNLISNVFETIFNDPSQKPTINYRFKRKDGEYRWIETTFTNLLSDRVINGIVLNFSDITEKRQIVEDLVIAKDKAEESDRLKTAFLQNMSHEIRTPMNAIMGFSELLLENLDNKEKLDSFVYIINQRCTDLLVIINDILDIAKIESGQVQLCEEKVNIDKLLLDLEAIFNEQKIKLNKANIIITYQHSIPSSELNIITDRSRLMQILTNLIGNALKYTCQGKIEFGFCINDAKQLEFYVSDTGIGIPKEKHDAIFERFIQLNQGTNRFSGGNGLGLAITKGLVKRMGGNIWLQSEMEKGSTFYFTIKTVIDSENIHSADNKTQPIKPDIFNGETVLVVEDDEYNRALIKEILNRKGLNLIFAVNGHDSIQMCSTTPIDLVLMDIGLPDISGYEAIKQILSNNSKIKIIAQTAYASPADKTKALQAGCIDYISKPLKSSDLIEIIKRHI